MNHEQVANNPEVEFKQAGAIKKNDFCMLADQPCKVV